MREPLTLEQFLAKEVDRKNAQISTTTGHIQRLTARKAVADGAEQQRLQDLIDLHTGYLAEVQAWDVEAKAQERFDKQQEKLSKLPQVPSEN